MSELSRIVQYVPSELVRISMWKAAHASEKRGSLTPKFVAVAYAVQAVALSFLHTFVYFAEGSLKLFVHTLQLSPKYALLSWADETKKGLFSSFFTAMGVVYIATVLLAPSSFLRRISPDQKTPSHPIEEERVPPPRPVESDRTELRQDLPSAIQNNTQLETDLEEKKALCLQLEQQLKTEQTQALDYQDKLNHALTAKNAIETSFHQKEHECHQLQQQLKVEQSSTLALQQSLQSATLQASDVGAALRLKEQEYQDLQLRLVQQQANLSISSQQLDTTAKEKGILQATLLQKVQECQDLQQQLTLNQGGNGALQQQLTLAIQEQNRIHLELQQKEQQHQHLQNQLVQEQSVVQLSQLKLQDVTKEKNGLETTLQQREAECQDLKDRLLQEQSAFLNSMQKLSSATNEKAAIENVLKQKEADCQQLEQKLNQQQVAAEELKKKLETASIELSTLQQVHGDLEKQWQKQSKEIGLLQNQLNQARLDKQTAQKKIEELGERVNKQSKNNAGLSSQLQQSKKEFSDAQAKVQQLEEELSKLKGVEDFVLVEEEFSSILDQQVYQYCPGVSSVQAKVWIKRGRKFRKKILEEGGEQIPASQRQEAVACLLWDLLHQNLLKQKAPMHTLTLSLSDLESKIMQFVTTACSGRLKESKKPAPAQFISWKGSASAFDVEWHPGIKVPLPNGAKEFSFWLSRRQFKKSSVYFSFAAPMPDVGGLKARASLYLPGIFGPVSSNIQGSIDPKTQSSFNLLFPTLQKLQVDALFQKGLYSVVSFCIEYLEAERIGLENAEREKIITFIESLEKEYGSLLGRSGNEIHLSQSHAATPPASFIAHLKVKERLLQSKQYDEAKKALGELKDLGRAAPIVRNGVVAKIQEMFPDWARLKIQLDKDLRRFKNQKNEDVITLVVGGKSFRGPDFKEGAEELFKYLADNHLFKGDPLQGEHISNLMALLQQASRNYIHEGLHLAFQGSTLPLSLVPVTEGKDIASLTVIIHPQVSIVISQLIDLFLASENGDLHRAARLEGTFEIEYQGKEPILYSSWQVLDVVI